MKNIDGDYGEIKVDIMEIINIIVASLKEMARVFCDVDLDYKTMSFQYCWYRKRDINRNMKLAH